MNRTWHPSSARFVGEKGRGRGGLRAAVPILHLPPGIARSTKFSQVSRSPSLPPRRPLTVGTFPRSGARRGEPSSYRILFRLKTEN